MIIDEALEWLHSKGYTEGRRVRELYLSNFFNCVRIDTGQVGAAMNYAHTDHAAQQAHLCERLGQDPLLLHTLEGTDLLSLSLRTALVSALSQPYLKQDFTTGDMPEDMLGSASRAVVVGFGGLMVYLITRSPVTRIHVTDLAYSTSHKMREAMDEYAQRMQKRYPHKRVTVSDGSDHASVLSRADLVCITGSALCNGTMEELLDQCCGTVVVQGESACIYPQPFFERGVSCVVTTLKPHNLLTIARQERQRFRALLEDGLKPVYLFPATEDSSVSSLS